MMRFAPSWQAMLALIFVVAASLLGAMTQPEAEQLANPAATIAFPYFGTKSVIFGVLGLAAVASMLRLSPLAEAFVLFVGAHWAAWTLISGITGFQGTALAPFYLALAAAWLLGWRCVAVLSAMRPVDSWAKAVVRLAVPALFGVWLLILWEAIVRGAGIPFVLLPPPSAIAGRIASSLTILGEDVRQTIFKSVLIGYAIGCLAGFIVAVLADRFVFLRRGLIPIATWCRRCPLSVWRRSWSCGSALTGSPRQPSWSS
jgi:NitT/TauT family transport system permease protein